MALVEWGRGWNDWFADGRPGSIPFSSRAKELQMTFTDLLLGVQR